MGLFGGGSSSTSTTSTTTSWLADMLEPIISDFVSGNDGINYENSTVAGLTPAEQAALNAYGSGGAITAGKQIAGDGGSLVAGSISEIQALLNGNGKEQFTTGVNDIYNSMNGFMTAQDSAIQDSVYSQMGAQFGQSAQSNMASTSVAGSSAAQNATNSILASGANSMVQQESDLSAKILSGAVGLSGQALSGELGLINELMSAGGKMFNTGSKMASTGQSNQFKAGLFEQYFNQENINNNRKNDMINNNMDWLNMAALLDVVLPAAGIDTTTTGTSTVKQAGGGSSLHSAIDGAAAMSALMFI